jgi:monoamine oxidase
MAAPAIFGNHLADLIDALTLDDIESLFGLRSPTPRIVELDRITLGEFLEQTVNGSQAAELIGATTGLAVWFENKSLGMFLRDEIMGTGIGLEEIEGGADLLPRALARFFEEKQGDEVIAPGGDADLPPDSILLNTEVSRILKEVADGKVELTLRLRKEPGAEGRRPEAPKSPDFREVTTTCEAVLCTLPFPLLEGSDPGETPEVPEDGKVRHNFGERKRQAIRGLSYASSTKILLHCRRRFWEQDEGIFGGASHSDQATRATYYPSDNAERKDSGRREPGEAGRLALSLEEERPGTDPGAMLPLYHRRLRGAFSGPASRLNLDRPDESAAMRMSTRERGYGPRDSAVSRGPGVLVASYSWGESAREFGKKDRATRRDDAIAIVSGFHHQLAEPGMVLGHESVFWDKHPWSGRAFCFLGPGDHPRHFEAAVAPEGRVYFAGEHCSLVQAWIQGALISALDAVRKIVHDL